MFEPTMKITIKILAIALLLTAFAKPLHAQKFEKAEFYTVMDSGDLAAIENQLTVVELSSTPYKEGYEGALLMRKADKLAIPLQKLKYFKQGRIKLETAMLADKENTEYHFLRLAIEEHAPKIVKYHSDIEADKAIIIKNFKSLSPAVQNAITDYAKKSKVLKPEDF